MNWQPIKTRPNDGTFLATLRVYSATTQAFMWWDTHVLTVEEDGQLSECHGWDVEDYEFWCPIPEHPSPTYDEQPPEN